MKILLALLFIGCAGAAGQTDPATLWIPEQMITDQTYHGVIILNEETPSGVLTLLSTSDDNIVHTQQSILILPHQNHGIFPIIPLNPGHVEIFATVDGKLYSAKTQVFSPKSVPSDLKILIPANKTRADSMLGYVVVLDENGSPVPVNDTLNVDLISSVGIGGPSRISVNNGTHLAKFEMDVDGTGTITASANSTSPHTVEIQKVHSEITARIAVAPDIALSDSYVFYYVWLEKDGLPVRPPHVVDAFVHSDNSDVARFGANPHIEYKGSLVHLVDGVARGKLYTGKQGHTTITASIAEFGSAQDSLFVGPARFDNFDGNFTVQINKQNLADQITEQEPNAVLSWIYPSVTDKHAWIVIAMYHMNHDESLEMTLDKSGDMDTKIIHDILLTPTGADGSTVHLSSKRGLDHKGAYSLEEYLTRTNAAEFPISGSSHGHYNVTVSGQDLRSHSTTVDIYPSHAEEFRLDIVPIPALPHQRQDIAMVSILDETGVMINVSDILERGDKFLVSLDSAASTTSPIHSNSAVIEGTMSGPDEIHVHFEGIDSASAGLVPVGVATSLKLLMPESVHVTEEFPFAAHSINPLGIPIDRPDDLRFSSTLGLSSSGNHLVFEKSGIGKTSVISGVGATELEVSGFENDMSIHLSLEKNSFRIGENITLGVTSSVEADYTLYSDFPFVRTGDTFVIIPDHENVDSVLTILATRGGYSPVSVTERIDVRNIFAIDITTVDSEGQLYLPFNVTIGESLLSAVSPYHTESGPDLFRVTFLPKHTAPNGYAFEKMTVNGQDMNQNFLEMFLDQDINIVATYQREILISVIDGQGGGVYREGDTVTISAPDRHKMWFLVRDVFDRWEGYPGTSRETFVATEDMRIHAMYREDHTYLMLVVAIPLLSTSLYVFFKNTTGFWWMVQNLLERIPRSKKKDLVK